jgi:hypothetical protein
MYDTPSLKRLQDMIMVWDLKRSRDFSPLLNEETIRLPVDHPNDNNVRFSWFDITNVDFDHKSQTHSDRFWYHFEIRERFAGQFGGLDGTSKLVAQVLIPCSRFYEDKETLCLLFSEAFKRTDEGRGPTALYPRVDDVVLKLKEEDPGTNLRMFNGYQFDLEKRSEKGCEFVLRRFPKYPTPNVSLVDEGLTLTPHLYGMMGSTSPTSLLNHNDDHDSRACWCR